MANPITEEDSILTKAIKDMSFNPWQADISAGRTPAQAYNEQRTFWMTQLHQREPWALDIFIENYPARSDIAEDGVARGVFSPAEAVAARLLENVDLPEGTAEVKHPGEAPQIVGLTPAGLPESIADYVRARAEQGVKVHVVQAPQEDVTKRETILRTANRLIHGDREQDYGKPIDSFTRLAAAFNIVLEGAGHDPIDPVTAAKLMVALKFARLAGGDNKDDTWVDLAGYSALGAEVWEQQ